MSEKKQKKKADSESKQEKANRIISEAIAKAKERGERNIPRVMSPENFPSVSAEGKEEKKGRKVKSKPKDKESKKPKTGSSSKIKEKTKIGDQRFSYMFKVNNFLEKLSCRIKVTALNST
ncbi:chromodomain-helicase-dna-binding protein 9 [Limosa lapponica baueri]|uniref:Chromodomain-helicase-dna-binding protein 9 n=1 Tax=Limosa lapponica baueri TaxID=1758121 RepID=A0A2I0T5A5_LIMLA|nr:chromodomain-helicase-dna-binding protein 9 [Limosa lapponica baueri]